MDRQRLFEGAMLWSLGVAMGAVYVAQLAAPDAGGALASQPAWVDQAGSLLAAVTVGTVLATAGYGYEVYRERAESA
jgi:hypothetical protein